MLPLKVGDTSFEVQTVRGALKARGWWPSFTVWEPNLYDSWVQGAVATFQQSKGLPVTGVVDQRTWTALTGKEAAQPHTGAGPQAGGNVPVTRDPDLEVGLASGRLPGGGPKPVRFGEFTPGSFIAGLPSLVQWAALGSALFGVWALYVYYRERKQNWNDPI